MLRARLRPRGVLPRRSPSLQNPRPSAVDQVSNRVGRYITANHDRYESLSFPYRVVGPNHVRLLQPKKR